MHPQIRFCFHTRVISRNGVLDDTSRRSTMRHMLILSHSTNHICTSSDFKPQASSLKPQASSCVRFHLQVPQSHTQLCSRVMNIVAAYRMTNFWGLAHADPFVRMKEGCRKLNSAIWAMKHMLSLKSWLCPFHYLHIKGVLFTHECTPYLQPMYYSPSPSLLPPIDFFKRGIYHFST